MARTAKGPTLFQRPGSPFWYFHFTGPDGARVKGSTGKADKAEGLQVAQRRYVEVFGDSQKLADNAGKPEATETLGWAIDRLLAHRATLNTKESTLKTYRSMAKRVLSLIPGDTSLRALTPALFHSFVTARRSMAVTRHRKAQAGKTISLVTVSHELAIVEMALTHARSLLGESSGVPAPMKAIPKEYLHLKGSREVWLDLGQANALLEHFRKRCLRDCDYLTGWIHTGARARELFRVQARHYNAKEGLVFLDGTKTKKARRWVPVSPQLAEVLARRTKGLAPGDFVFPATTNSVWHVKLARACTRLGLPRVSILDLRHTFASIMVNANVSSRVVAECLGHASTVMVDKTYGHMAIRNARGLVCDALAPMERAS